MKSPYLSHRSLHTRKTRPTIQRNKLNLSQEIRPGLVTWKTGPIIYNFSQVWMVVPSRTWSVNSSATSLCMGTSVPVFVDTYLLLINRIVWVGNCLTIGSFRNIKMQLDIKVQMTQTTEMNKHDYEIKFVCVLLALLSSWIWIYWKEPILLCYKPLYRQAAFVL